MNEVTPNFGEVKLEATGWPPIKIDGEMFQLKVFLYAVEVLTRMPERKAGSLWLAEQGLQRFFEADPYMAKCGEAWDNLRQNMSEYIEVMAEKCGWTVIREKKNETEWKPERSN